MWHRPVKRHSQILLVVQEEIETHNVKYFHISLLPATHLAARTAGLQRIRELPNFTSRSLKCYSDACGPVLLNAQDFLLTVV